MKIQSFLPSLGAALLLSLFCALPFLPQNRSNGTGFVLEARVTSGQAAVMQVYFDVGKGTREEDSSRQMIPAGAKGVLLSLPLPEGRLQGLRLDPLDRSGRLVIEQLRIRDLGGRTLHSFKADDFEPVQQLECRKLTEDSLEISSKEPALDPILFLKLPQPMELHTRPGDHLLWLLEAALPLFLELAILLWLASSRGPKAWLEAQRDALAARPRLSIALASALAVILACYSILFLGRSYVSPNHGSILLYENYPTVPGSTDSVAHSVQGSDIGATMWQTVPYAEVAHRALFEHGELPLWNRMNSGGVTLLGQGQSMVGDPLHLLLPVLFNGSPWAWDLKFVLTRWLFALGIGLIAWRLTRHLPSSVLSAVSAAFVGFFLHRFSHPAYSNFCYSPWILLGWLALLQAQTRRELLLSAGLALLGSWGTLTGGAVKEAYMLLISLHLSGALMLVFSEHGLFEKLHRLLLMTFTGLVFVLLSAPLWMSFLESLKRAYTSIGENGVYQIQGGLLLGLFDELFYRPLVQSHMVFCPSANLLVLAAVLYFLVTLRKGLHSRASLGLAASTLPPFLLAFGVIPGRWIKEIPFLGVVAHIDNTFSCVLIVLLCCLTAPGLHAAWRRLGTKEGRSDLLLVLLGLAVVVGAWLSFAQAAHRQIYGNQTIATLWTWGQRLPVENFVWISLWLMLAALLGLLLTARRCLSLGRWSAASLLLCTLFCTLLFWRQALHHGAGFEDYLLQPGMREDLKQPSEALETARKDAREPFRIAGVEATLFPGWSAMYGLEGIGGPDALMSPTYRELVDSLGIERLWDWRLMLHGPDFARTLPACSFLNVRYFVAPAHQREFLAPQLTLLKSADLDVYRNDKAWPRAFFTDRLDTYEALPSLARRILAAEKPFAAVQRGDKNLPPAGPQGRGKVAPAINYKLTANTTRFVIDAPAAGYAVLHETLADLEFRAYVDGKKTPYFRVNHAFKAVRLESPGRHEIVFEYVPRNWLRARLMALSGLVLLGAVVAWEIKSARNKEA